jgi:hypothetical protein
LYGAKGKGIRHAVKDLEGLDSLEGLEGLEGLGI